jgi:thiamine pyrophosphate-dependent acetolactate synthase large subunit-like protein
MGRGWRRSIRGVSRRNFLRNAVASTGAAVAARASTARRRQSPRSEGPGFTDRIGGIACATAPTTPLLVVASNVAIQQEDTTAGIQLCQQPTTRGLKKYGKRLATPTRVHEYAGYAFRQFAQRCSRARKE